MPIASRSNRLALLSVLVFSIAGCSRSSNSDKAGAPASQNGEVNDADSLIVVRGVVVTASADQVVLKTDSSSTTVKVIQPFQVYEQGPSDLSHVKESTFIGVTTVKQPDGSEQATEIHVFPEDLRGVGEGSRMMTPPAGASASRMTNGNVTTSRMTNGTATPSRMSNGSVSRTDGSTLVVQYPGGSQNVTVPANTPVTELKASSKSLAAGDQAVVLAKRARDGSLAANKAIFTGK